MPQPAPFPQAIERREAPPVGFGAPTASGAAGTATPAESQAQSSPSRPEARATPETAAERHTPVVRQPTPRRTERAQPEPAPRVFTPLPPETTLPPTRGFGDLPRPPGLVGAQ